MGAGVSTIKNRPFRKIESNQIDLQKQVPTRNITLCTDAGQK